MVPGELQLCDDVPSQRTASGHLYSHSPNSETGDDRECHCWNGADEIFIITYINQFFSIHFFLLLGGPLSLSLSISVRRHHFTLNIFLFCVCRRHSKNNDTNQKCVNSCWTALLVFVLSTLEPALLSILPLRLSHLSCVSQIRHTNTLADDVNTNFTV